MRKLLFIGFLFFSLTLISCGGGSSTPPSDARRWGTPIHNEPARNASRNEPNASDNTTSTTGNAGTGTVTDPFSTSFGGAVLRMEPNEQRIKHDLVGRTISEPTRRLHRSRFEVRAANNVRSVTILSENQIGNQRRIHTCLTLNDGINTYVSELIITYVVNYGEWELQHIESRFLDIVATGLFCNCIVIVRGTGWTALRRFLYNNCDITLIVEGRWFDRNRRGWFDFAYTVPGNGSTDFWSGHNDNEYIIERIERP